MIRFLQQDNGVVKFVFWAIILVVSGFMVITLVPGIFSAQGDAATDYAVVRMGGIFGRFFTHNETVPMADVQRQAEISLQRQKLPPQYLPLFIGQAGNQLVMEKILIHQADKLGLKATDADLRAELQQGQFGEAFFPGGKFVGDDAYANIISSQMNLSVEKFESLVKDQVEVSRLRDLVTAPVTVSAADVRSEYVNSTAKVKFQFANLNPADVLLTINPTDAELESYFKANTAKYANAAPETRKIQYVNIDPATVAGGTPQVTDADLQAYYQKNIAQFQNKEQVKVRHILIAVNGTTDDAAAQKKAQDIEKQLKAGGDFAKLAEANSDDPGSKTKGGDLGFIQRGVTVPEFEKVAFSQNPGQISDPVKTQFGYHIIQTEEKQPGGTRSFAEVKPQILAAATRQKELDAAKNFANKLAGEAKSGGLAKAAAQYKLTADTTDYIGRNGIISGLPDSAQVLDGAFKASANGAPQVASTGEGFAVYQVTDIKPAHAPSFAEYKDHVLQDYRSAKLNDVEKQKMQQIADQAKAGGDLEKAAKAAGANFETSDMVARDGQPAKLGPIASVADQLFALNVGQVSGVLNGAQGAFVAKVLDKQMPTDADIQSHFDDTKTKLLQDKRDKAFEIYVSELQRRYQDEKRILIVKQKNKSALDQSGL